MSSDKSKKLILLEKTLRLMAVLVLKKYNPRIVGITGSIGKTSSKEAVFSVLASHFRARQGEKNYNNEIGIPLTVIGAQTGERSFVKWLHVFIKWIFALALPLEYPEVLILEMGADRPGDMAYLTSFIKPELGILTDVSGSHLEYFRTIEGVAKEKGTLLKNISEKGVAILNIDNPHAAKIKSQLKSKTLTFGFSQEADVRATDVSYNYAADEAAEKKEIRGLSFKLNYKGTSIPMRLNYILAQHSIYAALAGVSAGIELGINLVDIGAALENFRLPPGRMALLSGVKNTIIIDDTYNASPVSTISALETLKNIEGGRKIAVLGDMLELGEETEPGHRQVARKFLEIKGDIFFAVGHRMQAAVRELEKNNFEKSNIYSFENPMEAGKKLQEVIQKNDVVLVKGSQGMRMEKIVEEVMAEPQRSAELLCRQSPEWWSKPWKEV